MVKVGHFVTNFIQNYHLAVADNRQAFLLLEKLWACMEFLHRALEQPLLAVPKGMKRAAFAHFLKLPTQRIYYAIYQTVDVIDSLLLFF